MQVKPLPNLFCENANETISQLVPIGINFCENFLLRQNIKRLRTAGDKDEHDGKNPGTDGGDVSIGCGLGGVRNSGNPEVRVRVCRIRRAGMISRAFVAIHLEKDEQRTKAAGSEPLPQRRSSYDCSHSTWERDGPVAITSDATTAAAKTVPPIILERVVIEFSYSSPDSNATSVVQKYGKRG